MSIIKLFGIGVTLVYLLSFAAIFIMNPQTIEEVNYLGITSFNLVGFKNQLQAVIFNYFLVGLFIIIFGFLLSRKFKKSNTTQLGAFFIVLSGLAWMSFSLFSLKPGSSDVVFGYSHIIRISVCWISGIVGLILISVDFEKYFQPIIMKWLTLIVAILMVLEPIYYIINDYSGEVSLLGWTIYMSWFLIFSTRSKVKNQVI